jgi:hypothetical protein
VENWAAADAVADRDLMGRLLLVLRLHQLLDRPPRLGKPLLNPGERRGQGRALPLQPARKLGNERTRHRLARASHVGNDLDQVLWILFGGSGYLVRSIVAAVSIDRIGGDPGSNTAKILDQCKTQHDGKCPQLT